MNKSLVTETPDMLYKKAEMDIMTVDSLHTLPKYPEDQMYDIICFHATQAIEIDISFAKIKSECMLLNTFTPNIKYSSNKIITKQDMDKIIKALETICNFSPIKAMRDSFSKEHNYKIVGEITTGRVN